MTRYNEYGYDDGCNTLTIPEEVRYKWREWKKETRDWRKHIEEHIDEQHDETQAHVTSETNRAITDIKNEITTSRSYIITEIGTKTSDIKSDINANKSVIDSIWNKVQSMTYYK